MANLVWIHFSEMAAIGLSGLLPDAPSLRTLSLDLATCARIVEDLPVEVPDSLLAAKMGE
jgi:hypothetical protein